MQETRIRSLVQFLGLEDPLQKGKNPKDSTQSYETTLIQRALKSTGQSGYQHLIAHGLGVVGDSLDPTPDAIN